jgi:hypothetical protein
MGLSDAQKTWMDQNWALFCVDEPWRKVDTKGPHADALARAKEQARTACPRVDAKPPGPAKTIGKKSKQANTLTAHPALAAGPEETCVVCLEKERTHCYIPCGHICICTDCINHPGCQMQCPICKGPGTLQRIFNA